MHIVLWDTRQRDATKDYAGGMGVGHYPGGGGLRGMVVRHFFTRDRRPVTITFAYLAAIFKKLGHTVEYSEDRLPQGADVYVFLPAIFTLDIERRAMAEALAQPNRPKVLAGGTAAFAIPEAFADLDVTVVKGEPEQLLWKLDEVLSSDKKIVEVGSVKDLDALPYPDWSLFEPQKFRIAYDFWKFPTGFLQQSRGCTFTCNYCPYIIIENSTRFRTPESVVDEMRHGMATYGFRSFKFRDPLFGLDRKRVLKMAELIGGLPRKVQFSVETRIDLMRPETLKALHQVGLTSITVGVETPDEATLRHYERAPIKDDKQREFFSLCRGMGIRIVAGFMVGFPHDTARTIHGVLRYAKQLNPTWANFNIVTPYPGTGFFEEVKQQIASFDFSKYNVYTPVMKYEHLTPEKVQALHAKCFTSYYFRTRYLTGNAHLVWPFLQKLGIGLRKPEQKQAAPPAQKAAA